ncbi:MAG TPA: zinc ribbon domain-containing protein [Bryobacteraceae bacterium]|nr:zinc ribbon domain-containing protein [Bryobacteraceae bacterium]
MIIATAAVLIIGVFVYTLFIRPQDLPAAEPESPTKFLEQRKAIIYENLRDLQFEYRVGKLSDADYQATKTDIQKELAVVLAEIDKLSPQKAAPSKAVAPAKTVAKAAAAPKPAAPVKSSSSPGVDCPHCGAKLPAPMKFCGECGAPMPVETR